MDSFIRFKFFYSLKILLFFWNYFILIKFFLEIGFILPILKVISSETYPRKTTDANWCFHWMVRTLSCCRITFEKDAKFICGGAQLPIFRSRPFGFLSVFQRAGAQHYDDWLTKMLSFYLPFNQYSTTKIHINKLSSVLSLVEIFAKGQTSCRAVVRQ